MNVTKQVLAMDLSRKNTIATVIQGSRMGQKAFYEDSKRMECEGSSDFFEALLPVIEAVRETGCMDWEGQKIMLECIKPQPKLVICGGGHISIPVIQIANMLEFEVSVLEDRPLFADHARRAGAKEVICDNFEDGLRQIIGDGNTYFVIVTRGHRYDLACLKAILPKPHAYIGMIGSKVRVKRVKELLLEEGFRKEELDAVYTPIGLPIKAESTTEIAISILAEIIKVKNEYQSTTGYTKEILRFLSEEYKEERYAMVTITERRGSAPRGVGTKMLVLEDGRMIGTIGGGCAEANIRAIALKSIRDHQPVYTTVDMTGKDAEEDGMVCGGRIQVWIEPADNHTQQGR